MTGTLWLLVGAGVLVSVTTFAWLAAKVGRGRDPYAALGTVESHRQARPDPIHDSRED